MITIAALVQASQPGVYALLEDIYGPFKDVQEPKIGMGADDWAQMVGEAKYKRGSFLDRLMRRMPRPGKGGE